MPTKLKRLSTVVDKLCSLYFFTTIFSNPFDDGKYIFVLNPTTHQTKILLIIISVLKLLYTSQLKKKSIY